MLSLSYLLALAAGLASVANAHTWLDCVDQPLTNNDFTRPVDGSRCRGFIRNFAGRLPGVNVDVLSTYRFARDNNVPICEPSRQGAPGYSARFPMTKAAPGSTLTFVYTENGHVSKDRIPPNLRPDPKFYQIHWNRNLNGAQIRTRGDLFRGNTMLKGDTPYDDGVCVETAGDLGRPVSQACKGNYTIPADTPAGTYQMIWWWKFDRDSNGGGEEYTSCFDVEVSGTGNNPAPPAPVTIPSPMATNGPAASATPMATPSRAPQTPSNSPTDSDGMCAAADADPCYAMANPNRQSGEGFMYKSTACTTGVAGTVWCTQNGCRLCSIKPWLQGASARTPQCPTCVYQRYNVPLALINGNDDGSLNSTYQDEDRKTQAGSSSAAVISSSLAALLLPVGIAALM